MASGVEYFLKNTLGEDFLESLEKVELWKPETKSTVDHEEIRTALQIVPRTVMALLIRELSPMAIGDNKAIPLFVVGNATLNITKHGHDVYSGDIVQVSKRIAEFKFRSLPGIGLVIMSTFELYDMENLINSSPRPNVAPVTDDISSKVQKIIDERIALHDLVNKVVDKKVSEKEAVNTLLLMRLTEELAKEKKKNEQISEVTKIATDPGNAKANEYMRGMANGLVVADSVANEKEPNFVEAPKKKRPLEEFLEKRKKNKEHVVYLSKSETVECPDCGGKVFDGKSLNACVCYGDNGKIFLKKTEEGIKVRFSKNWDEESIEMLLEVLRKKHG